MPTPSGATQRYCREFLQIGPSLVLRGVDDNDDEDGLSDAQLTPPFCRFGPTLMLFFTGEARTLDAGDSFAQGGGSVSSYSWSGGGSGSTKSYSFGSPGSQVVTCTVTDGNGVSTTGRRFISVCNRPGVGDTVDQAITSFRRGPIRATVAERGWTGATVDVEILDASIIDAFALRQTLVIYRERFERTAPGAFALESAGEVFSGVIVELRKKVRKSGNALALTVETIESAFQSRQGRSVDIDDQVFVSAATYEANEVSDPLAGGGIVAPVTGSTPATNALAIPASHKPSLLTVGWVQSHLLNWHALADIDGATRRFPEIVDVVSDWWNLLGGATASALTHLNVPRGPLKRAIEDMLTDYLGVMYCNPLGQVNNTVHHAGKGSADAVVDTIDEDLAYELDPMGDDEQVIRQVTVTQSAQAKADLTTEALKGVHPSSPSGGGSPMQVEAWFTTQAKGDALAEAYFDHANANGRIRAKLPGATFGPFNVFTALGDDYWVESYADDRPNIDFSGDAITELVGRRRA
jgi:hypothetical protein